MILKADLHIHSALSGCGSLEMSPRRIVLQAKEAGLQLIAICDHNQMENSLRIDRFAREQQLFFLYGVEAQTIEEVHFVCLFEKRREAEKFFSLIYDQLPDTKNNPEFFGDQPIVDENEEIVCFEEKLLANSLRLTADELSELVKLHQGIIIPAHIDRYQGLYMTFGFIPEQFQQGFAEIYYSTSIENFLAENSDLKSLKLIKNSDAHYLKDIGRGYTMVELGSFSLQELEQALKRGFYKVYP